MKIVWAFDPFQESKILNVFGKKILGTLFDQKDSITVLYVASNTETQLTTAYDVPERERFSKYPKDLIAAELKKIKLLNAKVEVVQSMGLSLTSLIKEFVQYTIKKKTDLVLVPSNSKTFLPRLIFGSFSETFVHYAECDLLVYHQKTQFSFKKPKKLLYAHDFSTKGNLGLLKVIEYAKKWNSEVIVVHTPIYPGDISLEDFEIKTNQKVEEINKLLVKRKIKHETIVTREMKYVHKIILTIAKKKEVDLVAISAQKNQLDSLLLGSNTRALLRETKFPALVIKV